MYVFWSLYLKTNKLCKMGSAVMLFFGVLVATLFLQISQVHSKTAGEALQIPDAELELESLDQVQEINEHNFKTYEIHHSDELPE